ncbi:MAG TPA: PP0621 family protein [Burkholderiales bacterium]|nr:PP0621 family protein [Burkholderiales bacterium]
MGRLVVLVVLIVLAVWLLRRALRRAAGDGPSRDAPSRARGESLGELVACAHCGVHLPRAEARSRGGAVYCSEEHARLGER